jgi:hypothetical protein
MGVIFHNTVLNMWDPSITIPVGAMSPEEIFRDYGRSIGIGGIAMAGIIGIVRSWGIIKSAVGLAADQLIQVLNPAFSGALSEAAPELIFKEFARHIAQESLNLLALLKLALNEHFCWL